MTRWEQTWAEAVLTAFVVDGSRGLNVQKGEVDYLSTMRRMRNGGTKLAAFGLRVAVWMVATAPLWLLGRFVMFGTLGRAERTELLCRLLEHKSFAVRELTLLLKLTAAMALLGNAAVRARSHYDAQVPTVTAQPLSLQLASTAQAPQTASTTQPIAASAPQLSAAASAQPAPAFARQLSAAVSAPSAPASAAQLSPATHAQPQTASAAAGVQLPPIAAKATVRLLVIDTQRPRVVS